MRKKYQDTMGIVTLLTAALTFSTCPSASVIINEIDYDQPGTDNAEFIELFNTDMNALSLDGYYIDLINGGNSSVYLSIDLTGFNIASSDYFVVCNDVIAVANCDYAFTNSISWIQNGAPDAVALYNASGLQDSLSYEGGLAPFNEGTTLTTGDSNSVIMSIARIPDGTDTNDNHLDFQSGCITPGTANISGTGDCSVPDMSAVPIPPAIMLFGSGLIGIAGLARRTSRLSNHTEQ